MMTTAVDNNIVQLAIEATSDHVDGWNKQRARQQLKEIREHTVERRVKRYIQGILQKK